MRRVPTLVFIFLVSLTSALQAQSTSANLTGRITDPSKAVIADAKIAAISADTNVRYETLTNVSGEYYQANLQPSSYRIEIETPGFRKLIKPDVILHVQDALEIDFEMMLGSASDSITVEAGGPLGDTESAGVRRVGDRAVLGKPPLNGRRFQTLMMLTPGVAGGA